MSSQIFSDNWVFPNIVEKQVQAIRFTTKKDGFFRNGRQKFILHFYGRTPVRELSSNDPYDNSPEFVLATRTAMELVSKKTGKPYLVCSTKECVPTRNSEMSLN